MNFPSYILIRDNNAVVDLNFFLQTISVPDKEHSRWATYRIQELDLVDGKDYIRYKNGAWQRVLVSIATFKQMLRTGRGDTYRQERAILKSAVETLDSKGVAMPDNLGGFTFEMFVSLESEDLTPDQLNKVPVLLIEGRAAVYAHELFRRLSDAKPDALTEWTGKRIQKHQLEEGSDYVSFKGGCPGRPMRTTNYVVGMSAAITIARGERKGKGRMIADYLTNILRAIGKRMLPNTAPLSDFVGLKPLDAEWVDTLLAQPPVEEVIQPEPVQDAQEPQPDNCNPVAVDAVTPEPFTSDSAAAEDNGLNSEPLGPNAEPQVHRTPTAEELGHDEESAEGSVRLDQEGKPYIEVPYSENGPTLEIPITEAPPVPPASELLLQAAQLLVQMAQLHVEHERKLAETSQTVGQIVAINQQAALGTLGLFAGNESIPEQTMRSRIRQIVNDRQRATGEDYDQVYAFIYNRLYYLYGVNVNARQKREGETYLALCERIGVLGKVYTIVTSAEFQVAAKNAPMQPKAAA